MGYFTQNIAEESKTPAVVSLSNNPNFIEFKSLDNTIEPVDISLQITNTNVELDKTKIVIIESLSYARHEFIGTKNKNEVNNTTFYVSQDKAITAENLRTCLLSNIFFKANFLITVPPIKINGSLKNGDTIKITSIGGGVVYMFNITIDETFINRTGNPSFTSNGDTIGSGVNDTEIELDIYSNTGMFLGEDDNNTTLGTHLTSLTKGYNGVPIWFNLNSLIKSINSYSNAFLDTLDWCNTGTITDYRFIAKRFDGYIRDPFYVSNVLYSITGYTRNLELNDLSIYVYDSIKQNIVKPLTTQPILTHIIGQSQYFNFIFSDPDRSKNLASEEYNLGISYRLYSQSKRFITEVSKHNQNRKLFNIVNTIKLDIDDVIQDYDNVGIVEIYLTRSGVSISEPLTFHILPDCLYKVNDFAFLNSLGGWSSFNFSGAESTDFKSSVNTIFKTQTPNYYTSSEIESVYNKEIDEKFTVQTMPINKTICDWLKEISSSIAVYELSTKRYIIVDDLNIKSNSKDELFRIEMKYRYSDSYNALIK